LDYDTILVIGIAISVLGVPSLIGAFSSGRAPRTALLLFTLGGGMIAWAASRQPGGYSFETLPQVIGGVVTRLLP